MRNSTTNPALARFYDIMEQDAILSEQYKQRIQAVVLSALEYAYESGRAAASPRQQEPKHADS